MPVLSLDHNNNPVMVMPVVVFDPLLFDKNHWNLGDGPSLHRFQIFCQYYVEQLSFNPYTIVQCELDGFIAILQDEKFFPHMWTLLDTLRRDQ